MKEWVVRRSMQPKTGVEDSKECRMCARKEEGLRRLQGDWCGNAYDALPRARCLVCGSRHSPPLNTYCCYDILCETGWREVEH